ncbi:flagellar hook-basal body complex protein FliE [bacterium]|nr:flagellar hook-basal body complex protein FliE [bacterium]
MASSPSVPGASSSQSFMDTLESVLQDTNKALKGADKAATDLTTGRADNLHNVMIAMEKADLSLRTVNSIRNKMVEAYQEIMRMQV